MLLPPSPALAVALLPFALPAQDPAVQEPSPQDDPAAASDAPEFPIFVTARRLLESLVDVPASVSAVRGEDLERSRQRTVRDASSRSPNTIVTEFTSRRLSFPFIRGIGSGAGEPAVVTYIDGVPQFTTGSTNIPLVDIDRVEFLRGPQSALYGRNALGGVMRLITERPADEPTWTLGLGGGNEGQLEFDAGFSGPITDDGPGASLSVAGRKRDGFTTNQYTGNDVDFRNGVFGRGQLLFDTGENSELRLTIHGEHDEDGGFALGPVEQLRENPFTINQDFEGRIDRDIVAPAAEFHHSGDVVDFTSITAYTWFDVTETSDFDFSPIDGIRRETQEDQGAFYQELRWTTSEAKDEGLKWVAGLTGFLTDGDRSAANDFRPGGAGILFPPMQVGVDTSSGEFDDFGLGAYGHVTLPVGESVEVAAGLRYDYEDKDADLRRTFVTGGFTAVDQSDSYGDSFGEFSPSGSVMWKATDDTSVYARIARAFKAGGFNLTAPGNSVFFDTETSWTYEVGVRHSFSDRVSARLALFHIDWDDMQLSQFDPVAGGFVDNVGESESQGIEFEVDVLLDAGFSAYVAAGLLDTEFDEYVDSFGNDNAGNDLPFAPDHTFTIGLQYAQEVGTNAQAYGTIELQSVGDYYFDASNLEDESFELVNVTAGYVFENWELQLWARNLFDQDYLAVALQVNPADPSFFVGENAPPRTFGFTLRTSL